MKKQKTNRVAIYSIVFIAILIAVVALIYLSNNPPKQEEQIQNVTEENQVIEEGPKEYIVVINELIEPAQVSLKVGDSVKWVNKHPSSTHTLVSLYGNREIMSPRLLPEQTYTQKFEKRGVIEYITLTTEARGTIIVS